MTGLESNQTTVQSLSNVNLSVIPAGSHLHGAGSEDSIHAKGNNNNGQQASANDLMGRTLNKLRRMPCAGIIMGMFSGIFFAFAGFIVKLIPNVNPVQIVVSRSIIQLIFYTPITIAFCMPITGVKGERWPLFFRGFFGFLAFTLCYASYRMIPLADASTIVFSAPVYVSIFACVLLKEDCGIFQAFNISITIAGVLLISKPTFLFPSHEPLNEVTMRLEGTIIAFISSLSTSFTFVMIRKLQKTPAAVVISVFSIVSIICGCIVMAVMKLAFPGHDSGLADGIGLPATTMEYIWLLLNGLCGVFGQLLLTVALKIEEAGLVSLARTIDIVMAFVFQLIWLPNELIHWTSYFGAVIVLFGVCISGLRKWMMSTHPEIVAKFCCWTNPDEDDDIRGHGDIIGNGKCSNLKVHNDLNVGKDGTWNVQSSVQSRKSNHSCICVIPKIDEDELNRVSSPNDTICSNCSLPPFVVTVDRVHQSPQSSGSKDIEQSR